MTMTDCPHREIAVTSADEHRANRFARSLLGLVAVGTLVTLVGCGTTQSTLPTVDDTQRRPVNSAAALELLSCRAEARALRLNLPDKLSGAARTGVACTGTSAPAPAAKPDPSPNTPSRSSRAVFEFDVGTTEVVLDETTRQTLLRSAQLADMVLVHAAGQAATADSDSRALAQATAQALEKAGIEPQKLRVSWAVSAASQPLPTSAAQSAGAVEVEFVERSARLLFSKPAAPASPSPSGSSPEPSADTIKPAVAALERAGKTK
jgi:hypothetical protein